MAQRTTIEWTESAWNPVRGCARVSEGCRNCYAEEMAARFSGPGQWGHGLAGWVTRPDGTKEPRWTGLLRRAPDDTVFAPLKWKRPRLIFVNSTSDLFHESVPDAVIDEVFAVMALTPQHVYQVLTKRPERMRDYLCDDSIGNIADKACQVWAENRAPDGGKGFLYQHWRGNGEADIELTEWPLPNVWLGVSVEDQPAADTRIPSLLATPAAVRFVSAEPLLGPVDLQPWLDWPESRCLPVPRDDVSFGCEGCDDECADCPTKSAVYTCDVGPKVTDGSPEYVHDIRHTLDWVICGGESGKAARPMHPQWARDLRDQCKAARVAFFFKQWGAWKPVADSEVPETFRSPECAQFRVVSSCGYVGDLSIGSAFMHKPARYPGCFPNGPDGDAICETVFMRNVGKHKAGRHLDGVLHGGMPAIPDRSPIVAGDKGSGRRVGRV
ncbi:MAG: phage Gp37/Gp68 family protein [Roseibium sp.]|nr:phage Gp37/Gp68 family protein [Roseibium sp.]